VTLEAVLREDGLDVAVEIHRRGCAGRSRATLQQGRKRDQEGEARGKAHEVGSGVAQKDYGGSTTGEQEVPISAISRTAPFHGEQPVKRSKAASKKPCRSERKEGTERSDRLGHPVWCTPSLPRRTR
jgi:hypothetical protein